MAVVIKLFVCCLTWCAVSVSVSYARPTEVDGLPHSRDFYAGYIKALNDNFDALFKPEERQTRSVSPADEKGDESTDENRTKILDELVDKNPQKRESSELATHNSEDISVHKRDTLTDDLMTANTVQDKPATSKKDSVATVAIKEEKRDFKMVDDTSMLNDTASEGETMQENNDEGEHTNEEEGSGEKKENIDDGDNEEEEEGSSGDKRTMEDDDSGDKRSMDDENSGDKRSLDDESSGDKRTTDDENSGDKRSLEDVMSGDRRSVDSTTKDSPTTNNEEATDDASSGDNDASDTTSDTTTDTDDASESTSDIMDSGSGTIEDEEAETVKLTETLNEFVKGEGNFEEAENEKKETRRNAEEEGSSGNQQKTSTVVEKNEQEEEGSTGEGSDVKHNTVLPDGTLKKDDIEGSGESDKVNNNATTADEHKEIKDNQVSSDVGNGTVVGMSLQGGPLEGGLGDKNNSIVENKNETVNAIAAPVEGAKKEEEKEEANEEEVEGSGGSSGNEKTITESGDDNKIAKLTEKISDGESDENTVIANDVVSEKKSDVVNIAVVTKQPMLKQIADDTNVKKKALINTSEEASEKKTIISTPDEESEKKTVISTPEEGSEKKTIISTPDEESNERNKKTVFNQEGDDDDDALNDPPPHVVVSSKKTIVPKNITGGELLPLIKNITLQGHHLHKKHHKPKHHHRYTPEESEDVESSRRGNTAGKTAAQNVQNGGQVLLRDSFTMDDDKALINAPEPSNYVNQIPGIETSTIGQFSDQNPQDPQDAQSLSDSLNYRSPVAMFYRREPDGQKEYENRRRHFILEHASMQHMPYMPGIMSGYAEDQAERGMLGADHTFMAPDNNMLARDNNMLGPVPNMIAPMNGLPGNNMALPGNGGVTIHDNQLMNEQYGNGLLPGNAMLPNNGMLPSNGILHSSGIFANNAMLPSNQEVASYRQQNAYLNQLPQQPLAYAPIEQNQYVERFSSHGVEEPGNQFLPDGSTHVPASTRSRVMNEINRQHNNRMFRMQAAAVDRFMHNAAQLYRFGNEFARHSPALMEQTGVVRSMVAKRRNPQDHVLLQPIVVLMPVGRWD